MKLIPVVVLAALVIVPTSGAAVARPSSAVAPKGMTSSLRKYKATITRKDARGNTKTFSDYCEATSYSEAQKTFEGRYPGAKVGGVIEVK